MAERTRRSRAAGSKMVGRYVGRTQAHPFDYGNPWIVRPYTDGPTPVGVAPGRIRSGVAKRWTVEGPGHPFGQMLFTSALAATEYVVGLYRRALVNGHLPYSVDDVRRELAGLDLACYCPLIGPDGERWPCHGNVLVWAANSPAGTLLVA